MSADERELSELLRQSAIVTDRLNPAIFKRSEPTFIPHEKEHLAAKLKGRRDSLASAAQTAIVVEDWDALATTACALLVIEAKLGMLK